ncbi:acyltransferase family protein [Albidovulum sediminicola]|uniref:Acyltransferase n=1 Tax=Albidovulum sediminicola TaxID=2984331 RepID=A0ABT2Z368_9RHOB|nr:acyltransferase [Defluviimonas sp. WL0075]MCV2865231.1 acyltransferase [Defluviimonas sp. WL0075]
MRSRLDGIQALRGIAALLVAGFHLAVASRDQGFDPGLFTAFLHGEIGVDIFFVISGFIIYHAAAPKAGQGAKKFLLARFWRIFPPYWAILSLYIAARVVLALGSGGLGRIPEGQQVVISALLLPLPGQIVPIAWTLSIEIVFYAIFAATFFKFGPRALVGSLLVWVGVSQYYTLSATEPQQWLNVVLYSGNAEFLYGVAIAIAHRRGRLPLAGPALALGLALSIALLAGWLPFSFPSREIAAGLPSALLVYGAVGVRFRTPRAFQVLGDASYLLYLVHILVYSVTSRVFEAILGTYAYTSPAIMLAMLAVSVTVSIALDQFGEIPYQRWYKRRSAAARGDITAKI